MTVAVSAPGAGRSYAISSTKLSAELRGHGVSSPPLALLTAQTTYGCGWACGVGAIFGLAGVDRAGSGGGLGLGGDAFVGVLAGETGDGGAGAGATGVTAGGIGVGADAET